MGKHKELKMFRGIALISFIVSLFFGILYLMIVHVHWVLLPVFCLVAAVLPQTSGDMRLNFVALSALSFASAFWFL